MDLYFEQKFKVAELYLVEKQSKFKYYFTVDIINPLIHGVNIWKNRAESEDFNGEYILSQSFLCSLLLLCAVEKQIIENTLAHNQVRGENELLNTGGRESESNTLYQK